MSFNNLIERSLKKTPGILSTFKKMQVTFFVQGMQYKPYLTPFNLYEGVDVYIAKCCISRMYFDTESDYDLLKNILRNFNRQVHVKSKSKMVTGLESCAFSEVTVAYVVE